MATLRESVENIANIDFDVAHTHHGEIDREDDIESVFVWMPSFAMTGDATPANTELLNPIDSIKFNFQFDNQNEEIYGRTAFALSKIFYPDEEVRVGAGSYQDWVAAGSGSSATAMPNDNFFKLRLPIRCPAKATESLKISVELLGEDHWVETPAEVACANVTMFFSVRYGGFDESLAIVNESHDAVANLTDFKPAAAGERVIGVLVTCMANRDDVTAQGTASNAMNYQTNYPVHQMTECNVKLGATQLVKTTECEQFVVADGIQRCLNEAFLDAAGDFAGRGIEKIPFTGHYYIPINHAKTGTLLCQLNFDTCDIYITTIYGRPGPSVGQNAAIPEGGTSQTPSGTGTTTTMTPQRPKTIARPPGTHRFGTKPATG